MVWEPASHRGCRTKELFFMGSKGKGKHFVGLRFAWHGLESCCCSGVSEPASKGLAPTVSELRPQLGCRTKGLEFIMGSKGNGKHFVGPGFAWHGLESCCCSGVSEPIEPTAMVGCKWTYQRTDHNAFSDNFMPVQIYLHYIYSISVCRCQYVYTNNVCNVSIYMCMNSHWTKKTLLFYIRPPLAHSRGRRHGR